MGRGRSSPRRELRGEKLSPTGGGFLYSRVAQELRRRILEDVYPPGNRIPTEAELVREFRVSAITVRRAVRDLTREGLLVGRQGLGVFVTAHRRIVRSFGPRFQATIADEIRRAGAEPGVKERAFALVPASQEVATRLGIRPGVLVHRHDKILLADGEPIGLDTTFFLRKLGDSIRHRLSQEFTMDVLRDLGIPMDHIDYEFHGSTLSLEESVLLGLPVGFPLLVVGYTLIGPDGTAVITGRNASRSDRFTYEFCGRPDVHVSGRGGSTTAGEKQLGTSQ